MGESSGDRLTVHLRALDDADPGVRLQAVAALASLGDAAAVPLLIRVFERDPATHVRRMAANALWRIGDPAAIEPLVAALLDRGEPPGLRSDCADALGQMADCGDLPGHRRSAVVQALLAVLGDESTEVRCFAAFALGLLRDPAALPALRRTLAADEGIDPRWGPVRDEAREAIALIEARPAAPP